MTELVPITKERHAGRTWQRPSTFLFAAKDPVVPVTSTEVPRLVVAMALAFVESAEGHVLVAVQGMKPGQNKFVSREGAWLGEYIPSTYRNFPFRLARNEGGLEVLCVDEAAAQVSGNPAGESFFMPDGSPSKTIADIFGRLAQLEKERLQTQKSCEVLAHHGLLEPWSLKAQDGEEVLEAKGLFRVNEAKLYALEPEALKEIRDRGGLMLAFGQLFSMQQVQKFGRLGTQPAGEAQPLTPKLSEENGIISFANL